MMKFCKTSVNTYLPLVCVMYQLTLKYHMTTFLVFPFQDLFQLLASLQCFFGMDYAISIPTNPLQAKAYCI